MENLSEGVRSRWERNAQWWDERIGDGNAFQRELIEPATLRLARTAPAAPIEYRQMDVTDRAQLASLGAGRFQGAVATMALMDIARIEPLFEALPGLLEPGGFFVFSVLHPCFSAPGTEMYAEERLVDGRSQRTAGLKVHHYRASAAFQAEGIRGQPEPSVHFHRSLETLLATAFRCGFSLVGLEEPGFQTGSDTCFEWQNMLDLAPVLVCRLRSGRSGGPAIQGS